MNQYEIFLSSFPLRELLLTVRLTLSVVMANTVNALRTTLHNCWAKPSNALQ